MNKKRTYSNTSIICILYLGYILMLCVFGVVDAVDWFPRSLFLIIKYIMYFCMFGYLEIGAIYLGHRSYLKTQRIVSSGLLYSLGYVVVALIALCLDAGGGWSYAGYNDTWANITFTWFIIVCGFIRIKLPLIFILSITSGYLTKVGTERKAYKETLVPENEPTDQQE